MSFSEAQLRSLQRNVPLKNLRSRMRDGRELTYIEGWYAIHVANKIFGFDAWDRETIEARCLLTREARGFYSVVYAARVRISVRVGDRLVVRDGHGTGDSRGGSAGEAHDLALKAAETDATKRALATFGNAFGLRLYAKGRGKARGEPSVSTAKLGQPQARTNGDGAANSPEAVREMENGDAARLADGESRATAAHEQPGAEEASTEYIVLGQQDTPTISRGRVDKSALPLSEPRRVRDKAHLQYVATQPCLLCSTRPSDAHHLRFAQPRALGRKVSDQFTVPLCRAHHRMLHQSGNELSWWHDMGIDPISIAAQLWHETQRQL